MYNCHYTAYTSTESTVIVTVESSKHDSMGDLRRSATSAGASTTLGSAWQNSITEVGGLQVVPCQRYLMPIRCSKATGRCGGSSMVPTGAHLTMENPSFFQGIRGKLSYDQPWAPLPRMAQGSCDCTAGPSWKATKWWQWPRAVAGLWWCTAASAAARCAAAAWPRRINGRVDPGSNWGPFPWPNP